MKNLEQDVFRKLYSALSEDNQKVVERLLNGLGAKRLKKERRRLNRLALNAYKRGVPLGDDEGRAAAGGAVGESLFRGRGTSGGRGKRGGFEPPLFDSLIARNIVGEILTDRRWQSPPFPRWRRLSGTRSR